MTKRRRYSDDLTRGFVIRSTHTRLDGGPKVGGGVISSWWYGPASGWGTTWGTLGYSVQVFPSRKDAELAWSGYRGYLPASRGPYVETLAEARKFKRWADERWAAQQAAKPAPTPAERASMATRGPGLCNPPVPSPRTIPGGAYRPGSETAPRVSLLPHCSPDRTIASRCIPRRSGRRRDGRRMVKPAKAAGLNSKRTDQAGRDTRKLSGSRMWGSTKNGGSVPRVSPQGRQAEAGRVRATSRRGRG